MEQKAQSGDTVYVGEGFYVADDPSDDNLLFIEKSIHLIGSCTWDATGPVTCALPTRSSRLNGEYERRVIAIQGPDISVTIEGFQIYQGNAHGKYPNPGGPTIGAGGGIYAQNLSQLVLKHNLIFSNKASDATALTPTYYACGGGIYAQGVKQVDIQNNDINFNTTSSKTSLVPIHGLGGGIYIRSCGLVNIESSNLNGNSVANEHGICAGLVVFNVNNLNLNENMFSYQNALTIEQFPILASALALYNVDTSSTDHNIFSHNYGISTIDATNTIGEFTGNKVWDNSADYEIAIYSEVNIAELKITNNFLSGDSTIINIDSLDPSSFPEVDIAHNTFSLAEKAIVAGADCTVNIHRNIFSSIIGTAIDLEPLTISETEENLFYNVIDKGEPGSVFWEGNPRYVDPSNGDFHIQPGSAAIDKVSGGIITRDIDGQLRPMGLGYDLGADEFEDDFYFFMPLILR